MYQATTEDNNIPAQETAFSEVNTEIQHEPTLFAEPVFHVGSFTITNSLLNSWLVVFLIVVFSLFIRKSIARIPRGIQNISEIILERALNLADSVTGSRDKTMKCMPIVFPLFVFLLLNNWLGIFPGVGTLGFIETHGNEKVFVPLLRGGTADLNTTLALAITAVLATHIFGVIFTSAWSHLNRFVGIRLILDLPRKLFREKQFTSIIVHPIQFFVGIVELVGEVAKVASLSFRLFGNIFAGEVLLTAMAAIFAYILPVPFIFLELVVGIIQALIFSMLTLVFLTVMTTRHEHEEGHSH